MEARVVVVMLLFLATTACAAAPSVDALPAGSARGPDIENPGVNGPPYMVLVPAQPDGAESAVGVPVPETVVSDPVDFFRRQDVECSQYAALAGRGDDTYPRVEQDRFTGAVLVRELDTDTALIEDGRGTRLVVDAWSTMGTVLPESGRPDDVMPAPYRTGCEPSRFVGRPG